MNLSVKAAKVRIQPCNTALACCVVFTVLKNLIMDHLYRNISETFPSSLRSTFAMSAIDVFNNETMADAPQEAADARAKTSYKSYK